MPNRFSFQRAEETLICLEFGVYVGTDASLFPRALQRRSLAHEIKREVTVTQGDPKGDGR